MTSAGHELGHSTNTAAGLPSMDSTTCSGSPQMDVFCAYLGEATHCARQPLLWLGHLVRTSSMYHYRCGSRGGGGVQGSLLCHDVGFLTLGPKLDPRLAPLFLLVDLFWTPPPPFQKSWIRPCTTHMAPSFPGLDFTLESFSLILISPVFF